jgi:hypothetical protein
MAELLHLLWLVASLASFESLFCLCPEYRRIIVMFPHSVLTYSKIYGKATSFLRLACLMVVQNGSHFIAFVFARC